VWLDPLPSPEVWAVAVQRLVNETPGCSLATLPGWRILESLPELSEAAEDVGMVRVLGLECPLDIFRRPNELEVEAFDAIWSRSTVTEDGVHLPDPLDLMQSKLETGRSSDLSDIAFLEEKVRVAIGDRLATATAPEAREIFDRISTMW
jgi:hypothetical protein